MPVTIRGSGQLIVQVVQTYRQDVQTFVNFGFTTFASAITRAITPTSSNNLVLVQGYICMGANSVSDNATPAFRVTRNGTPIAVGTAEGNRVPATGGHMSDTVVNLQGMSCYSFSFLDTPATTSSVTYAIEVQNRNTGYELYVGRNGSNGDTNENKRLPTILICQEVST